MRKKSLGMLVFLLLCMLTACKNDREWETVSIYAESVNGGVSGTQNQNDSEDEPETEKESDQQEETGKENAGSKAEQDVQSKEDELAALDALTNSWYGEWQAVEALFPGFSAMSREEAESYLGETFSFSVERAVCMGVTIQNPDYRESLMQKEDFAQEAAFSLDRLGVNADSIRKLEILNAPDSCSFGAVCYVADMDTIYTVWDGAWLRLAR